jgi:hypothetical protein
MNRKAFELVWGNRVHEAAEKLSRESGAGAVLIAIFDAPWMAGKKEPALLGLAGKPDVDRFRLARDIRLLADQLEKSAAIQTPGVHTWEDSVPKPTRD